MINLIDRKNAIKYMKCLNGKKLQYITRSCDLVTIGFGDLFTRKNRNNKETSIAKYSINVQCPFKITDNKGVLLGSDDLFHPVDEEKIFVDLNINDSCCFDKKIIKLVDKFTNEYVENIEMNVFGDFIINLSNISIHVYNVNSVSNKESWRFFEVGATANHLVRYGTSFNFD